MSSSSSPVDAGTRPQRAMSLPQADIDIVADDEGEVVAPDQAPLHVEPSPTDPAAPSSEMGRPSASRASPPATAPEPQFPAASPTMSLYTGAHHWPTMPRFGFKANSQRRIREAEEAFAPALEQQIALCEQQWQLGLRG